MSKLTSPHRPPPRGRTDTAPGRTDTAPGRTDTAPGRTVTGNWRWLCATDAGVAADGPRLRFATQQAAQHWLDRHAEALLGQHIAWVTLSDGERVVGGALSLR
jgi:hypothetical protein